MNPSEPTGPFIDLSTPLTAQQTEPLLLSDYYGYEYWVRFGTSALEAPVPPESMPLVWVVMFWIVGSLAGLFLGGIIGESAWRSFIKPGSNWFWTNILART